MIPFVVESYGGISAETLILLHTMAAHCKEYTRCIVKPALPAQRNAAQYLQYTQLGAKQARTSD
jgi:hypothetical protein